MGCTIVHQTPMSTPVLIKKKALPPNSSENPHRSNFCKCMNSIPGNTLSAMSLLLRVTKMLQTLQSLHINPVANICAQISNLQEYPILGGLDGLARLMCDYYDNNCALEDCINPYLCGRFVCTRESTKERSSTTGDAYTHCPSMGPCFEVAFQANWFGASSS